MNERLLDIGVVVFIIYAVINVSHIIEMRRTSIALRRFIEKTEENLHPALSAGRSVLEDIGRATHNIVELTERIREVAATLTSVEKSIRGLYEHYKEGFGEATYANIAGLKAGVKAGVATLFKDLNDRKEGSS